MVYWCKIRRQIYLFYRQSSPVGILDGLPLKQLRDHVMNKCCKWNLSTLPKKSSTNKILFKSQIRLIQKAKKKYWGKKVKDVLRDQIILL